MKIMQILNGNCHWDATHIYPTLTSTSGQFAPDIEFVEAPDTVVEGWAYDSAKTGDERFSPPAPSLTEENADMRAALGTLGVTPKEE